MKKQKKPPLTKNGQPVKMPGPKHIQVQRGLAIQVLNSIVVTEHDNFDGVMVPVIYEDTLVKTIESLGYDHKSLMAQMIKSGYLVPKDEEPDAVSFYVVTSKKVGQALQKSLQGKKKVKAA